MVNIGSYRFYLRPSAGLSARRSGQAIGLPYSSETALTNFQASGGVDFIAAPAISHQVARQINVSVVLIMDASSNGRGAQPFLVGEWVWV